MTVIIDQDKWNIIFQFLLLILQITGFTVCFDTIASQYEEYFIRNTMYL